jgi:hypothetical protein
MITRQLDAAQTDAVHAMFLKAYRYQYIVSGIQMTRFPEVLFGLITPAQRARVEAALAPLF